MSIDDVRADWCWDVMYWGGILGYFGFDEMMKFVNSQCAVADVVEGPLLDIALSSREEGFDFSIVKLFTNDEYCGLLCFTYWVVSYIVMNTDVLKDDIYVKFDSLIGLLIGLGLKGYYDMDRYHELESIWGLIRPIDGYNSSAGDLLCDIEIVLDSIDDVFCARCMAFDC